MTANARFAGKSLVVRVDDASVHADCSTFVDDLAVLTESQVRPILIAPQAEAAREIVRIINRSTNIAVALSGSDAAMLPQGAGGLGRIQTGILSTLVEAGYIPVIEPTAFSVFSSDDAALVADEVAAAI